MNDTGNEMKHDTKRTLIQTEPYKHYTQQFAEYEIKIDTQLEIKYGERLGGFTPLLPEASSFLHPQITALQQTINYLLY